MAAKRPARPREAYHHGNLREALVERAFASFAQRGGFDFTLRELARELGVTHNAPYRHFSSKEDLVDELARRSFAQLAAAFEAALEAAGDDPRDRVHRLGVAYVRFATEEPEAFRLVLASSRKDGWSPHGGFDLLAKTLDEAQRSGVVRADLTPKELALAAWALVHGLASLVGSGLLPASGAQIDRYVAALSTVFFEGAGAVARTPRPRRARRRA